MIKIIDEIAEGDFTTWGTFVENHSQGNFFQSPRAFELFYSVDGYEPLLLVAYKNNKIVGSLLAVFTKEGGGIKGFLSRRFIVWGGPLVLGREPTVYSELLKNLNQIASRKAIYIQFRNFFDLSSFRDVFEFNGFEFEEHLNILIDLTKNEESLWQEVHSKRRNEIRRARKEGTKFVVSESIEALHESFKVLEEVYQRAKLPLPKREFFENAYKLLGRKHFKVFNATVEDKIIGVMFALIFKDTIYDWYAGSYKDYYKKYPNDLIPWEVFLWGKEKGFTMFDFGGAGKPNIPYGVRDYKKKFGGEFVNYGRFEKINKPILYSMGKLGLSLYQKLKI